MIEEQKLSNYAENLQFYSTKIKLNLKFLRKQNFNVTKFTTNSVLL